MAEFEKAYAEIMANEGGYVNDPTDRGAETYCGIARRWFPNWEGFKIIDELRSSPGFPKNLHLNNELFRLVRNFYRAEFWDGLRLSEIDDQNIATEVFDTAVNMGKKTSITDLQRAYDLLNDNGRLGEDILADGIIGSATIKAVNGYKYPQALASVINGLQFSRYVAICEKDKTQERFLRGWIKRIKLY